MSKVIEMQTADDSTVIGPSECFSLLATVPVGRIALSMGALPVVLPVNFAVIDTMIMIRTGEGAKLAAAADHAVVAFEADAIDHHTGLGWSIQVQDLARVIAEHQIPAPDLDRLQAWGNPDADHVIAIPTTSMTGRRVALELHLGQHPH